MCIEKSRTWERERLFSCGREINEEGEEIRKRIPSRGGDGEGIQGILSLYSYSIAAKCDRNV